ncbi:DEAD-domain-containing protein [Xylona heveae TC161]|uniref:RNA helicase n=1 Tax=Xylona heveae (strain CBS 132557 / TC161) TaxID=1328760 RepID=A0A165A944_XYLHT|nr:DEAD-domain-containing protein [Xylona heveae TC161]KZF20115.1 DEAD-domain-containing protein [Xylona heveae TC161]
MLNGDAPASKKSRKDKDKKSKKSKSKSASTEPEDTTEKEDKEAKKERKRLRKLQKAEAAAASGESTPKVGNEEEAGAEVAGSTDAESEKKAEKAKRKAEKEARKASKRAKKDAKESATDSSAPSGSSSESYREDPALTALPQSEIDSFLSKHFVAVTDPKASAPLRPIVSFAYLPVTNESEREPFKNFSAPTPIQAASWPFLLSGRDMIGVAETGSGKTMAFGVPCIRAVSSLSKKSKGPRAVIVSPTRELAQQINDQMVKLATPAGLSVVCVYGGVPKEEQRRALKTASIVVATPGRLNDLIDEGAANLSQVNYVVLDEADRMLDKGFEQEIRKIISTTSASNARQTLMFTATWPPSVRELAATFMNDPVKITIGDNPTGELRANTRITQTVEVVDPRGKEQRLLQLLKQHQSGAQRDDRILVFCLYKKEATRVENFLRAKGLRVAGIHGDLSQQQRTSSLDAFKQGKVPLLVATDVAARGLDIPAVKMVINVTFPLTVEDYVHRIGRTGRAGQDGAAITLFTEHDKAQSGALINVLKAANQPVPQELLKFGTTVKKKSHDAYGAFFKDTEDMKPAKKITFDD